MILYNATNVRIKRYIRKIYVLKYTHVSKYTVYKITNRNLTRIVDCLKWDFKYIIEVLLDTIETLLQLITNA